MFVTIIEIIYKYNVSLIVKSVKNVKKNFKINVEKKYKQYKEFEKTLNYVY